MHLAMFPRRLSTHFFGGKLKAWKTLLSLTTDEGQGRNDPVNFQERHVPPVKKWTLKELPSKSVSPSITDRKVFLFIIFPNFDTP
jgi:hypothetical protein